jgi:hypothetical protein
MKPFLARWPIEYLGERELYIKVLSVIQQLSSLQGTVWVSAIREKIFSSYGLNMVVASLVEILRINLREGDHCGESDTP